ncbi:hypothetical protein GCM10018963_59230 [Saccharothrix longispora]
MQAALPVQGDVHGVALVPQRLGEQFHELAVVLDEEQSGAAGRPGSRCALHAHQNPTSGRYVNVVAILRSVVWCVRATSGSPAGSGGAAP